MTNVTSLLQYVFKVFVDFIPYTDLVESVR